MQTLLRKLEDQATPTVIYGGCILVLLMTFLAYTPMSTGLQQLRMDVQSAKSDLANLKTIESEEFWTDRLAQSLTFRQQAQSELWAGETSGLVAADFQQTIRQLAGKAQIRNLRISVDPDLDSVNTVPVLNFEVRGFVPSGLALVDVLSDLAAQPRKILIQDLNTTLVERSGSMLVVSGYIPVNLAETTGQTP